MNQDEILKEIIEIRERVSRNETAIDNLIQQQTAIDKLAQSVQEMAQSLSAMSEQSKNIDKRLSNIETEKGNRAMALYTATVGTALGAIVTYLVTNVLK